MGKCCRAYISFTMGKCPLPKSGLLILAHNLYTHSLCISSKIIFIQIYVKNCAALDGIFQNLEILCVFCLCESVLRPLSVSQCGNIYNSNLAC